jgi:predicted Rossmann fold flavoprotein
MMQVAIIGAGAAGCFAAANIFTRDIEVTVFEKASRAMQKVKVSGGGRCNTTHACFNIPELVQRYPRGKRLLQKTLYRFGPHQTINWFEKRGVKLKAEEDGRMFPTTDDSQTIIDCIWQQMMQNGARVIYNKAVKEIEKTGEQFTLHFADGTTHTADKVIIACGGFPKADQYSWLLKLGHTISNPVPSLFTFNIPKHPVTELMGVSVPHATVRVQGTKMMESGPLLITHWGLSGPAVLRTSAWAARELSEKNYDFDIQVNWLGDATEQDLKEQISYLRREQGKQLVNNKNPFGLPKRLWEYHLQQAGISDTVRWGDMPAAAQNKLITNLVRETFHVRGKTTFKEEFVTCGGISLSEINPATMESRVVPGIYFAGELLDVDGITGGFNFQHAWSSSYIAADSITKEYESWKEQGKASS